MYKYFVLGSLLLFGASCNAKHDSEPGPQSIHPATVNIATDVSTLEPDLNEPIESFSDDSNIGRRKKNKVLIDVFELPDSSARYKPNNRAIVKFYSLTASKDWELKQTIEVESHALSEAAPIIEDFNNDGLKDITFVSDTAARGANVVRTLLIYDKLDDVLVPVKNSADYPNLSYNKTLNCIDAWMFHGATTTVFLKLEGDMLREFASVDTGAELVVTVTNKDGKEREIMRKTMREDDIYTRYRTFNPPRPYFAR